MAVRTGRKVAQLCREMDVSRTQIYDIRNEKIPVSDKMWRKLIEAERRAGIARSQQHPHDKWRVEELKAGVSVKPGPPGVGELGPGARADPVYQRWEEIEGLLALEASRRRELAVRIGELLRQWREGELDGASVLKRLDALGPEVERMLSWEESGIGERRVKGEG